MPLVLTHGLQHAGQQIRLIFYDQNSHKRSRGLGFKLRLSARQVSALSTLFILIIILTLLPVLTLRATPAALVVTWKRDEPLSDIEADGGKR